MKTIKHILTVVLVFLTISTTTILAQQEYSIQVGAMDFYQQQDVFSDIGLQIPSNFTALPKGQSITTKIINPAWLINNGWKTAIKGDALSVTCIEQGQWNIRSTMANKPFSIQVGAMDFYQPQDVLSDIGLQIPSNFTALQKGKSITTKIINPTWLNKNGLKKAVKGDAVTVICTEQGKWSIKPK